MALLIHSSRAWSQCHFISASMFMSDNDCRRTCWWRIDINTIDSKPLVWTLNCYRRYQIYRKWRRIWCLKVVIIHNFPIERNRSSLLPLLDLSRTRAASEERSVVFNTCCLINLGFSRWSSFTWRFNCGALFCSMAFLPRFSRQGTQYLSPDNKRSATACKHAISSARQVEE